MNNKDKQSFLKWYWKCWTHYLMEIIRPLNWTLWKDSLVEIIGPTKRDVKIKLTGTIIIIIIYVLITK